MPLFTSLMIVILVGSLAFFVLVINRLLRYNRRYDFPESKYTKLFKLITKEHVAILYVLAVIAHTIFTIRFLWTL